MKIFDYLKTQIEWLKSFLQEPDGKGSIKRLIMFLVTIAFLRAYFKVTVGTNQITDIPANWMFLIAGIIGLGILDRYIRVRNGQ